MNNNNCGFTVFEDPLGGTYVDDAPGISTSYVSPDCYDHHSVSGFVPNAPPTIVSEPSVLGLLLVGIVTLGLLRRMNR